MNISRLAAVAREQLQPGLQPSERVPLELLVSPVRFAVGDKPLTVQVRMSELVPAHIWGMATFENTQRAWIWLNSKVWTDFRSACVRARFSVAHELGHVLLHRQEVEGLDEKPEDEHHVQMEEEADLFATHLLMPDAAVLDSLSAPLYQVASQWGVSDHMLRVRREEVLLTHLPRQALSV